MKNKSFEVLSAFVALFMLIGLCAGCQKDDANEPANRLEAILQRGYIEVATEPAFAPNEFMDPSKPEGEQVVGSDIEFAKYIAEKLGVRLVIKPLDFVTVLTSVSEGKYDLAISALGYTPARAESMEISKGYYYSPKRTGHGIAVRNELLSTVTSPNDLADKSVAVQKGSLQELFLEQVPAYKELKYVSATTDGFLMLQEGKADAMITAITTAQLFIDSNPTAGFSVVEGFEFYQDESTLGTRVGIPKGETELLNKINEIIDEVLSSGIYQEWYDTYTDYAKQMGV